MIWKIVESRVPEEFPKQNEKRWTFRDSKLTTQNKLLLINKQNDLNFDYNRNLTKHEWSNWGTGLWICKCVSFWLKAWLIFIGPQLLPHPGCTSWLRFPLFTLVVKRDLNRPIFSVCNNTNFANNLNSQISRERTKEPTMCNPIQQKTTYFITTVYNAKNCLRSLISESHTLVEKAMTSWVKGCPRARGAEPTEGVQVPWIFRYVSRLWRYQTGQSWEEDLDDISDQETGCKVVEIEIPTADGYPVASWWDYKHCGKRCEITPTRFVVLLFSWSFHRFWCAQCWKADE